MKTIDVTALIKEMSDQLKVSYADPTLSQQYAWWLLEAITKKDKAHLIAQEIIMFNPEQEQQIDEWLTKLIHEHIPIQYLIGSVPFNDIEILVQPPILIPRPETEEWCLWLIKQLQHLDNQQLTMLDLATGSGCIALTLAHHFPQAKIYASDISSDALDLAKKNAEHNKILNVSFMLSDLFTALPTGVQFDLIVSNPPYITSKEWEQLDVSVTEWEDKNALIASEDGLAIIKQIINTGSHYIRSNVEMKAKNIPQIIIEIGHLQGKAVLSLMHKTGYNAIKLHKDLAGKDRFVSGRVDNVATSTT